MFLGFALGSAGTLGEILGIPFDIRHIASASAHFGVAMQGLEWSVPGWLALTVAVGIMLIGLVNFLVSFGLSLALAMESRQVTFSETRELFRRLLLHLLRRPLDFFIPPRRGRTDPGRDGQDRELQNRRLTLTRSRTMTRLRITRKPILFDVPSMNPRVTHQVPTAPEAHLIVRVPTKFGQPSFVEQAILDDVLGAYDLTGPESSTP